jgi:hypothetical protein
MPTAAAPDPPPAPERPGGTYLAECFWPGVSETELAAAASRVARDDAAQCLEVILIPRDEIVLCLYRAPTAVAVTDAIRRAGFPAERIVESVRIRPEAAHAIASPDSRPSPTERTQR